MADIDVMSINPRKRSVCRISFINIGALVPRLTYYYSTHIEFYTAILLYSFIYGFGKFSFIEWIIHSFFYLACAVYALII